MGRKKKLEPNWDMIKPRLLKSASSSVNEAWKNYGKAINNYFKYTGFNDDGVFTVYNYEELEKEMNDAYSEFNRVSKEFSIIKKAVEEDDKEILLAILEGRFNYDEGSSY